MGLRTPPTRLQFLARTVLDLLDVSTRCQCGLSLQRSAEPLAAFRVFPAPPFGFLMGLDTKEEL